MAEIKKKKKNTGVAVLDVDHRLRGKISVIIDPWKIMLI